MDDVSAEAVEAACQRLLGELRALAAVNPQVRTDLRLLAGALLAATELPESPEALEAEAPEAAPGPPPEPLPAEVLAKLGPALTPSLDRDVPGRGEHAPYTSSSHINRPELPSDGVDPNLALLRSLSANLRLKSEATDWSIEQFESQGDDADYSLRNKKEDLYERALKLDKCFLWMTGLFLPSYETLSAWREMARCFETLARVCDALLSHAAEREPDDTSYPEKLIFLAAEAQSALRAAVPGTGQGYDPDQVRFFGWIADYARTNHHFIPRYMRQEDLARPDQWREVQEALDAVADEEAANRKRERTRNSLMSKVRYHANKVHEAHAETLTHDWNVVISAVEELVELGLAPSDRDLRTMLLPIMDFLPELEGDYPGVDRVIREIDRYLANRPVQQSSPSETVVDPLIARARTLLAGKSIMIIGGEKRLRAEENLQEALGLKRVVWVTAYHHQSIYSFRPVVERDDVDLVCLLIRWSSHAFGDVKTFCDEMNKPLVRLPGGYNPKQMAHQILEQVGERLAR